MTTLTTIDLYLASEEAHPPPPAAGDPAERSSFIPSFEPGSTNLTSGGVVSALAFVEDDSPALATEDHLLIEANYPSQLAPRAGTGPGSVRAEGHAAAFTDRADFLSRAWATLGEPEPTAMRIARARMRRCRVVDLSALAAGLTEVQPPSKKITRLSGEDSDGNPVNAWVYVETSQVIGGKVQRVIHQIGSPCLLLPPSGQVQLTKAASSGNKSLSQFINDHGAQDALYIRAVCWVSSIQNNAGLQANANLPPASPPLQGTADWRGQPDIDELC